MKNYFKLLITLVMVISICCHCSEKEEGTPPPPTEQEGDETPDSESDNPVPETVPSTDGSIDNMESGGNKPKRNRAELLHQRAIYLRKCSFVEQKLLSLQK